MSVATQAVTLNPLLIKGHYRMGRAFLELEHYDEALQAFDEALKLKPDVAEVVKFKALTEEQARAAVAAAAAVSAAESSTAADADSVSAPHVPATPMAARSIAPVFVQSPGGTVSEIQHRCMYCDCLMVIDTLTGDHTDACPRSHLSTMKRLLPESEVSPSIRKQA
jgi:hypothetical protein